MSTKLETAVENAVKAAALFAKTKKPAARGAQWYPNVKISYNYVDSQFRVESTGGPDLFVVTIPAAGVFPEDRAVMIPAVGAKFFRFEDVRGATPPVDWVVPAGTDGDAAKAAQFAGFPDRSEEVEQKFSTYSPERPMQEPERPVGILTKHLALFDKAVRTASGAGAVCAAKIRPGDQHFGRLIFEAEWAGVVLRYYVMPCRI